MARKKFKNGMVVWAKVPDHNGVTKPTPRPLLITSIHPTDKQAPFVAHCISTKESADPKNPIIEMPWDAKTGAGTGLYARCFLVIRWLVIVEQDKVESISGEVDPGTLGSIVEQIARLR